MVRAASLMPVRGIVMPIAFGTGDVIGIEFDGADPQKIWFYKQDQ